MSDAPHIRGGRTGSWSSPAIPTTPISGRPGRPPAGSTQGSAGWLVCCTSGDAGGEDPDADPLELAAVREREQRAAAAIIGYAGVSFLHMPDGALVNDLALREQLVREIRTFRPDAVLATDPSVLFYGDGGINHTDHREAGLAAVDAVYPAARNPMAFPGPRPIRSGRPQGPPAVPVLAERAERPGRHHATLERKIAALARPRQPDQGARPSSTSGSGRGRPRRASRSGSRPARRSG